MLLAALAMLGLPASLMAQTIVPVEQEPSHVILFENAVVRVIDAAVPVGQRRSITPIRATTSLSPSPVDVWPRW